MSSGFYTSIIEEEKEKFGITNERLRVAARAIVSAYSKTSLKKGTTYIDYEKPECRCAYLYRYANLHTGMVTKYFRKFANRKEVRNHFQRGIEICSLGGGPGTDIVGILKALAIRPYIQQRIKRVSILDICGGWCNTFENIISGLLKGQVEGVSETFKSSKKLKHELIEVDLLKSLPENVMEIISKADIICMVKFISVVLAKEGCLDALKALGNLFKPGVTVFFIDNYEGNVFEFVQDIFKQVGLEMVLGPLLEVYAIKQHNEDTYGCLAQNMARISVVGFIKRDVRNTPEIFYSSLDASFGSWSKQDDFICSSNEDYSNDNGENLNTFYDKFVQTEIEDDNNVLEDHMQQEFLHHDMKELTALMEALNDLKEVIKKIRKNRQPKHQCCHFHSTVFHENIRKQCKCKHF